MKINKKLSQIVLIGFSTFWAISLFAVAFLVNIYNWKFYYSCFVLFSLLSIISIWSNVKWRKTVNSPRGKIATWLKIFLTLILLLCAWMGLEGLKGPRTYIGDCTYSSNLQDRNIRFYVNGHKERVEIGYDDYLTITDNKRPTQNKDEFYCNSKIKIVYISAFQKMLSFEKYNENK